MSRLETSPRLEPKPSHRLNRCSVGRCIDRLGRCGRRARHWTAALRTATIHGRYLLVTSKPSMLPAGTSVVTAANSSQSVSHDAARGRHAGTGAEPGAAPGLRSGTDPSNPELDGVQRAAAVAARGAAGTGDAADGVPCPRAAALSGAGWGGQRGIAADAAAAVRGSVGAAGGIGAATRVGWGRRQGRAGKRVRGVDHARAAAGTWRAGSAEE